MDLQPLDLKVLDLELPHHRPSNRQPTYRQGTNRAGSNSHRPNRGRPDASRCQLHCRTLLPAVLPMAGIPDVPAGARQPGHAWRSEPRQLWTGR